MATFTQALLLGAERLNAPPAPPHAALADAWNQLDWAGAKDAALLDASALLGTAAFAGAPLGGPLAAARPAPADTQPLASLRAIAVLRRLLTEEARMLLPEWLELCAARGQRVPPFFLRALFEIISGESDRAAVRRVISERGRWLALQNPAWSWVTAEPAQPDPSGWETGTEDERLGLLRVLRATDPAQARALVEKTWADDPPELRTRVLERLRIGLSLADEAFLTRALTDRRKEIRAGAQSFLALLPESALAGRMRIRANVLLRVHRGLLGRKLEVALPEAFDPSWKSDGLDEKPPTGVGEKAFWTQQILGLLPPDHWRRAFDVRSLVLIELAEKTEWSDLLLGAWYRATVLHGDAEMATLLLKRLLGQIAQPKFLPPNTPAIAGIQSLLLALPEAERWHFIPQLGDHVWNLLSVFRGTPKPEQARALLEALVPSLRQGYNLGGSPTAVLAARTVPPSLRDEAARLLQRDHGLSKPAEAFLQALDLRTELHAAFA